MSSLQSKKILLGITGGIAAYKVNGLVRDLKKRGAEVKVILTPCASDFVTPLTLSTLSGNAVESEFYDAKGNWTNHVELGLWADLFVIAPCTANTLAKMAGGLCDNLLLATYLSARCTVMVAPAMDLDMYAHPSTRRNLETLASYGNAIIPAEHGELASGLTGQGRMAEPETIVAKIEEQFTRQNPSVLKGKKVLVTAGPTYEAIDPVRFVGNHSSGKMGFAIAEEAAKRGAHVVLISGPSAERLHHPMVELHRVISAREMHDEVFRHFATVDLVVMSAAVADYAPKNIAVEKIKKKDDELAIELVKNPDILGEMGERKKDQFLVGFALETENEIENAKGKLSHKNLDAIVLNSLKDDGAGFGTSTNRIRIISKDELREFDLKSKKAVAADLLDFIEEKLHR